MSRPWLRDAAASLALLAFVVGVWAVASQQQWVSKAFLPSPAATGTSLMNGLVQGHLADAALATTLRMLVGWLMASCLGVVLGVLIGSSVVTSVLLRPTLEFIRPLPASAMLPVAIAIFGLSPTMVMFVVAFGAMWPVLLATVQGLASVHPQLREVSQALQLSRWNYTLKIGLPNAMADILAGMRLALTVSLIVSIVGEMVASQPGLGQSILLAARSFRTSDLFAGVMLLSAIGFLTNGLLALAERALSREAGTRRA